MVACTDDLRLHSPGHERGSLQDDVSDRRPDAPSPLLPDSPALPCPPWRSFASPPSSPPPPHRAEYSVSMCGIEWRLQASLGHAVVGPGEAVGASDDAAAEGPHDLAPDERDPRDPRDPWDPWDPLEEAEDPRRPQKKAILMEAVGSEGASGIRGCEEDPRVEGGSEGASGIRGWKEDLRVEGGSEGASGIRGCEEDPRVQVGSEDASGIRGYEEDPRV